jgi:hypothetical protein
MFIFQFSSRYMGIGARRIFIQVPSDGGISSYSASEMQAHPITVA